MVLQFSVTWSAPVGSWLAKYCRQAQHCSSKGCKSSIVRSMHSNPSKIMQHAGMMWANRAPSTHTDT